MSLLADAYVQLKVQGQQAVYGALNNVSSLLNTLAQSAKNFIKSFNSALGGAGSPFGLDRWVRVWQTVVRLVRNLEMGIDRIKRAISQASTAIGYLRVGFSGVHQMLRAIVQIVQRFLTNLAMAYPQLMPALAAWRSAVRASASDTTQAMTLIVGALSNAQHMAKQTANSIQSAFRQAVGGGGGAAMMTNPYTAFLYSFAKTAMILGRSFVSASRVAINAIGGIVSALKWLGQKTYDIGRTILNALLWPLRKLYDSVFSLQGLLATLGITLSAAMATRYIAHWTADAENAQVTFEVLLGSAGRAKTLLTQLQELADKTPLQLPEVRDAAKHLLAMGVSATQVTDTIRRLGDVSQGLGLDLNHVADIYGKVSQANRLTGEDMRRFRLNGIPIARELAIMMGKSTKEIEHMAHTGQISFQEVEMVFRKMTDKGGIFFELLKKKAQTLSGLFSTMQDSLRNLAVFFGQGMAPAVANMERRIIAFLDGAKDKIWPLRNQFRAIAEDLSAKLPGALKAITNSIPHLVEGMKTVRALMRATHEIAAAVGRQLLQWVGGTDGVTKGLSSALRYVRFLAQEWRLVFDIATTRARVFVFDWQNELLVAFGNLFETLEPHVIKFGNFLLEVLGAALEGAAAGLLKGLSAVMNSPFGLAIFGPLALTGGNAINSFADDLLENSKAAIEGALKRFDIDLAPNQRRAKEESAKLADLLGELNQAFVAFLHGETVQEGFDKMRKLWEKFSEVKPEALVDTAADLGGELEKAKKSSSHAKGGEHHSLVEFHRAIQKGIKTTPEAVAQQQRAQQIEQQKKTNSLLAPLGEVAGWIKNQPGAWPLLSTVFGP